MLPEYVLSKLRPMAVDALFWKAVLKGLAIACLARVLWEARGYLGAFPVL